MVTHDAKSATVAVTGAAGSLGQALCRELINSGYKVKDLVRQASDAETFAKFVADDKFEVVIGDIRQNLLNILTYIDSYFRC